MTSISKPMVVLVDLDGRIATYHKDNAAFETHMGYYFDQLTLKDQERCFEMLEAVAKQNDIASNGNPYGFHTAIVPQTATLTVILQIPQDEGEQRVITVPCRDASPSGIEHSVKAALKPVANVVTMNDFDEIIHTVTSHRMDADLAAPSDENPNEDYGNWFMRSTIEDRRMNDCIIVTTVLPHNM